MELTVSIIRSSSPMKKLDGSSCRRPHVLIFPFPAQSHVNTTLKLAEHLCLAGGIDVTLLTSDHICNHHLRFTGALRPFDRWSHFKLETISDGLPEDHPRCGNRVTDMFHSVRATTRPAFRDMVVSGRMGPGSGRPPVTCIIADGVMSFAVDVAKEIGVPSILFRTVSASCFWAYFCIPRLIEAGHLPFKGNNLDMPINGIPGMEGFLRRRDIPGFCQCNDLDDVTLRYVINEGQQNFRADAIMFNTFEELESPVLNRIRQNIPQLYLAAVERAVREVLDERKDEFRGSAEKFKKLAESQWRNESPDGSGTSCNSWPCFERLVQDLRAM
ncbi:hypothetical protein SAY86_007781 [Trapa natans]|uniref:Uncharacterized protein n=1 Tax=Trapa natans TaxID=22666 RepID=A0AAN7QY74_TRANT|nr:hypothetical protein SAY86_007781 [Trapa natans]